MELANVELSTAEKEIIFAEVIDPQVEHLPEPPVSHQVKQLERSTTAGYHGTTFNRSPSTRGPSRSAKPGVGSDPILAKGSWRKES